MDEGLRVTDWLRFPLQLLITSVRKKPIRLQMALHTRTVHVTYNTYPSMHCFTLDLCLDSDAPSMFP